MTQLNIIKMSVLLRLTYRFNAIPMKIPAGVFVQTEKLIVTFLQKPNQFRKTKTKIKTNTI